jgi:hypothetical protein
MNRWLETGGKTLWDEWVKKMEKAGIKGPARYSIQPLNFYGMIHEADCGTLKSGF